MVSASKMRRAQEQVKASQPYANRLATILHAIGQQSDPSLHPLLRTGIGGNPALLLISTDRGLCGSLNVNLFKMVLEFQEKNPQVTVIAVGKKAQEFANRIGLNLDASFANLAEKPGLGDVLPIAQLVTTGFMEGKFASVDVLHMEFINTLTQKPQLTNLLPLKPSFNGAVQAVQSAASEYLFEPSATEVLADLLPYYLETTIYQLLLDAKASEHSARMVSMQSASNNANDVVNSLRLEYNKGRQASITKELLEITTASLTLSVDQK